MTDPETNQPPEPTADVPEETVADVPEETAADAGQTAAAPAGGAQHEHRHEIDDYLKPEYTDYGHRQVDHIRSIGYFLPLLHELFTANQARTELVFALLYSLMTDSRVQWHRDELDEKLHWIRDGQRSYLLQRLSNVGWLEYYRDQGAYMLSDKGEALMRILSRFTLGEQLVANEGTALAEIEFSMLLDLDDLTERLQFLRNRLAKHNLRAKNALESDSAYRVLEVYQKLQAAYRWAEQTREALDELEGIQAGPEDERDTLPTDQWQTIRSIHDHLSTLHAQISQMQLVLQESQHRQINIAKYGITHLDVDNFLINSSVDRLAAMMNKYLHKVPHPFLTIDTLMFSEAESILTRELPAADDERGWETDVAASSAEAPQERPRELVTLEQRLRELPQAWQDMADVMHADTWEIAAHRFQILTLLADSDVTADDQEGQTDALLIRAPVDIDFDTASELVEVAGNDESWHMTPARIRAGRTDDSQ